MERTIWISIFSLNDLNEVWNDSFFPIDEIYEGVCALFICEFEWLGARYYLKSIISQVFFFNFNFF